MRTGFFCKGASVNARHIDTFCDLLYTGFIIQTICPVSFLLLQLRSSKDYIFQEKVGTMQEERKEKLIDNLTNNLPVLRAMLHLSQMDLAEMLGISRQQVVAIEGKKRKMSWTTFLSAVLIFRSNEETNQLLSVFGIYTEDLDNFIKRQGLCINLRESEDAI